MVATVGSIRVLFEVNHGPFERKVRSMASTTEQAGNRMQRAVRGTDAATASLNRTMARLRGREFRVLSLAALRTQNSVERLRSTLIATTSLFGGFTLAFSVKALADYSDTYKEVGNRLRVVKKEATSLAEIEQKIFETAQKSRAEYHSTGVLYARLANSARRLSLTQEDVLRVTETIQKAFLVGGATTTEATQSAIQLSQGIASNRLQGDELRSVLENPALGQLLAEQITGGDIGKLREIAADGELTAKRLIDAFKAASGEIDELFSKTEETISQAFVKLDNAIIRYIGTSENANSASRATVTAINALTENFDTVGDSIMVIGGALAGLVGARGLGGLSTRMVTAAANTRAWRIETRQMAAEAVTLANAEQKLARAEFLRRRLELNRAYSEGVLTMKQVARMETAAADATVRYRDATKTATAAQTAQVAALRATTPAAIAASGAMRGLGASMAFLGGPVGVALLSLGAIFFVAAKNAQKTAQEMERFREAAEGAQKAIEAFRNNEFTDELDLKIAIDNTRDGIAGMRGELSALTTEAAKLVDLQLGLELTNLAAKFRTGALSGEDLTDRLKEIGNEGDPALRKVIDRMIELVNKSSEAVTELDKMLSRVGMVSELAEIDPFRFRLDPRAEGMEMLRNALFNERIENAFKDSEKTKPPKKTKSRPGKLSDTREFDLLQPAIDQISELDFAIDDVAHSFGDFIRDMVVGGKSAQEAMMGLANRLLDVALQLFVIDPLVKSIQAGLSGGFFGGGTPNFFPTIGGDPWAGMRVATAHSGWTVGGGRAPGYRRVHPGVFANAPRLHGGLGNDEFAAILQDGERVLTRDQTTRAMGLLRNAAMGGGGRTEVNVYNNSGAQVSQERRSSGGVEIVDIVIGAVNEGIAKGKFNNSMSGKFGVRPQPRPR